MALRLWTGPSGSGKTRFLFEYVLKEARDHRELNYIVIVPEQFTLSTQKELIRLSRDHGILNVDVLSFARLAYRIFEEVGFKDASGISVDDMGKNLILRHLAAKFDDELTVFSGNMDKLGYITEVKSAISEFMQYGIGVDRLKEMQEAARGSKREQLALKLHDMEVLYREFNSYIENRYITKEEILNKASRAVNKSLKIKKSVVVFDGFTGFTPVQYDLLESLLRIARDIHVTILTDTRDKITYNTEHELFYLGYKTSEKLKKIAELNNIPIENEFRIDEEIPRRFIVNSDGENEEKVTNEMLVHLEKNIFREYSKPFKQEKSITDDCEKPTKAVNDGIGVFSALQPIDEVRKVAVEIQKIIRNAPESADNSVGSSGSDNCDINNNTCVRYRNIAIATGDLENYGPLFKRVFREYDIPYFIDKTQPVLINPFIEYIRALLAICSENFSYSAVFRYMRSPLADYKTSDIDKLENFVLKFGIKGLSNWKADWSEKYSWYFKNMSENNQLIEKTNLNLLNEMRQKLVNELSEVTNLITTSNKKDKKTPTKSVNEINAVFMGIFSMLDLEKRIDALIENYSITDGMFESEHKKEYEKIYNMIINLFDRMSELLGDEEITLKEYGELLDAGFDEIRIGLIPTITDYIQIGDVTRSRFENVHTLFIVGANDGVIPQGASSGGIISDIEKEFIINNTPDIELSPTVREKAYTGQLYLYMLMTKPTHNLRVSFSRLNSNSESLRPSYIIKVLCDMFPDLEIEKDTDDSVDRIYNLGTAFDVLSENINDADFTDLISLFVNDPKYGHIFKDKLRIIADASFMSGVLSGTDTISKTVAGVLYGKAIIGSVTRLEQFAKCSFNYFLKYGLSLKEREMFDFESKDLGTVFHGVLERYSKYLENENISWTEINEERQNEFIENAVNECVDDPKFSVLNSTFRHKYLVERINRISKRSISVLTEHLKAGKFAPQGAEISFSAKNNLDSFKFVLDDDGIMKLNGTIDRLDTCSEDDKVFVKVIDYKSGNRNLDLIGVYKGLSLQLVVYYNASREIIENDPKYKGKKIIPAGILYYHIDDPLVEGTLSDSYEDINEKIAKELKMKGIVNSDKEVYSLIDDGIDSSSAIIPVSVTKSGDLSKNSSAISTEQFGIVSEFVNYKIRDIGNSILSGSIKAEPHTEKGVDLKGCEYCPYIDICKFDFAKSTKTNVDIGNSDASEDGTESDGNNAEVTKDNVLDLMKEYIDVQKKGEES